MDIKKIAEDLISLKFQSDHTLNDCLEMFYSVMRKHGIKEGLLAKCKGAILKDNPEWVISKILFLQLIQDYFNIEAFMLSETPNDLRHY